MEHSWDEFFEMTGISVSDEPDDCHNHCAHWDINGECCECGDTRTPNHDYITEQEDS